MKSKFLNGGFLFASTCNFILLFIISSIFVEEFVSGLLMAAVLLVILYAMALTPVMDWYYRMLFHVRRPNELENNRLKRIWKMVCKGAENKGVEVSDNIELFVSDKSGLNAFAVAGHTIAVHRELLGNYIRDDEIAGVLAHELAHLVHGDTICLIMSIQGTTVLGIIRIFYIAMFWIMGKFVGFIMALAMWNGNFENGLGWGKIGNFLVIKLGALFDYFLGIVAYIETIFHRFFGRKNELEADRFSTLIGFGNGLVDFFHRSPEEDKINKFSLEYLLHGTHPPTEERIECIQKIMQEMKSEEMYARVPINYNEKRNNSLEIEKKVSHKTINEISDEKFCIKDVENDYNVDEQYDIGMYCLNNRRAQEGIEWLIKAADNNHPKACTELGFCYLNGKGVEFDKKTAVKYLKKAFSLNEPKGAYLLAECYASVKEDDRCLGLAAKIYYKAAKMGYKDAQAKLGICFLDGIGVEENHDTAFILLKQSTENENYRIAGYPLARCYLEGIGTDIDYERGIEILEKAIDDGCQNQEKAKQLLARYQGAADMGTKLL